MDRISVSQLTADELRALEGTDRIKDGMVELPQLITPVAAPSEIRPLSDDLVPEPSPEVVEAARRLAAVADSTSDELRGEEAIAKIEAEKLKAELEGDKAAFLAHVLGAPHFLKTYTLFGGAVTLTFRTLEAKINDACTAAVMQDKDVDQDSRVRRLVEYQMAMSVSVSRNGHPDTIPLVHDVRQSLENLLQLPNPLVGRIRMAHNHFFQRVLLLTAAADQPDFWKAAPAA